MCGKKCIKGIVPVSVQENSQDKLKREMVKQIIVNFYRFTAECELDFEEVKEGAPVGLATKGASLIIFA